MAANCPTRSIPSRCRAVSLSAAIRKARIDKVATASHGPSGRDDTARSVANDGPGGSRDVSDRRLRGDALSRQSAGQIREELLFAAEEMRYPGNIDPESLGRVERHHGRIADRPARQAPATRPRPRPAPPRQHADSARAPAPARAPCRHADRASEQPHRLRENPARSDRVHGHERLMTRRLAGPPPDPIGRPGRQVERDDPSHRRPPESRYGVQRHGSAGVRPASEPGRDRALA